MSSRVAGAVSRNPTFRQVSRTLRQASVRMSGMMGDKESRGRMRLDGEDVDDSDSVKGGIVMEPVSMDGGVRPERRPPELLSRLRGKTLGVFGPNSRTRRFMDDLLRFP